MTTSVQLNAALINALAAKISAGTATTEEVAIYTKGLQLLQAGTDFEAITTGLADQVVQSIQTAETSLTTSGTNAVTAINGAKTSLEGVASGFTGQMNTLLGKTNHAWGVSTGKSYLSLNVANNAAYGSNWSATIPLYDKRTNRLWHVISKPDDSNPASYADITIRHQNGGVQTSVRMLDSFATYQEERINLFLPLAASSIDPNFSLTHVLFVNRGTTAWRYELSAFTDESNWASSPTLANSVWAHSDSNAYLKYDKTNKTLVFITSDGTQTNTNGQVREAFADGSNRQVTGNPLGPSGFNTYTADTNRFVNVTALNAATPVDDLYLWGNSLGPANFGSWLIPATNFPTDNSIDVRSHAFCPQYVMETDGTLNLYKTMFVPIIDTYTPDNSATGTTMSLVNVRGYHFTVLDNNNVCIRHGEIWNPSVKAHGKATLLGSPVVNNLWAAAMPYGYHLADDTMQSIYTRNGKQGVSQNHYLDVAALTV